MPGWPSSLCSIDAAKVRRVHGRASRARRAGRTRSRSSATPRPLCEGWTRGPRAGPRRPRRVLPRRHRASSCPTSRCARTRTSTARLVGVAGTRRCVGMDWAEAGIEHAYGRHRPRPGRRARPSASTGPVPAAVPPAGSRRSTACSSRASRGRGARRFRRGDLRRLPRLRRGLHVPRAPRRVPARGRARPAARPPLDRHGRRGARALPRALRREARRDARAGRGAVGRTRACRSPRRPTRCRVRSRDARRRCTADARERAAALEAAASAPGAAPRNAPCPCGSGLRYRDCHGAIDRRGR